VEYPNLKPCPKREHTSENSIRRPAKIPQFRLFQLATYVDIVVTDFAKRLSQLGYPKRPPVPG
jgi:hypothetical protein